jgi:Domain of unknown function (DUF222)
MLSGSVRCCPRSAGSQSPETVGTEPYIESVFENGLSELDAAGTLAAAEANEHTLIAAETRRLQIAAHWADLHSGDAIREDRLPGAEHPVRLGGDGTPTVADFAPAELACVLRLSDGAAAKLIGDALDLRHRLPLIWTAALAGQAPAYQARHIASATRHLTKDQAAFVDARLAPSLGAVSWNRLHTLLEAAIYEADPVGAEQRAALVAQERFVRLGRNSEHGLKMIIARATAGDAIWFKATIDRIADILTRQGDTDTIDVRRSKAIGILAQPAEALRLLFQHQDDDSDGSARTRRSDQEPAQDEPDLDEPDLDQPAATEDGEEGTEPDCGADSGSAEDQPLDPTSSEEATHRSLQILPPPFNPDRARPRAIVYVHLSVEALTAGIGIARVENVGPVLLSRLQLLLGDHCRISLKPVIDLPAGHIPVDCYEIPASLREQLQLRYPADVFPYANTVGRPVDMDHTIPYLSPDKGGPPGQTRIGNLGPHIRYHHRVKTFGGWQVWQPEPGTWLWRSPHGWIYLVNGTGTHPCGNTQFAQAIWRAASQPQDGQAEPTTTSLR